MAQLTTLVLLLFMPGHTAAQSSEADSLGPPIRDLLRFNILLQDIRPSSKL